ncbi:MAG: FkbM family methyltransferase [Actinomycetota bacterium]|nr:FkbM family methyltransferase [Actinomycetota bacterium]
MIRKPWRSWLQDPVYGAVELATRRRGVKRVVNDEVVRFPARFSRYYPSDYEREKHDFLVRSCRPGSAALDLGAHLGLFTVTMARAVGRDGRVIAVEPTSSTREALRRTVRLNALDDVVDVRAEVVTDRAGQSVRFFETSDPLSNANSVVETLRTTGSADRVSTTIDDLVDGQDRELSCVKLDIEGAELAALQGAERTVRHHLPALAIEVHPRQLRDGGWSAADLWAWLADTGYDVRCGATLVSERWFSEQEECFEIQAVVRRQKG